MNNTQLAIQFFVQIAVILGTCRLIGVVAARLGQPQVIAEMIAGICLGPSLLGTFFPEVQAALFPWNSSTRDTQSYLFPAAQLGLALYMFVIGMEFRLDVVQTEWKSALAVSVAGMVTPFVLGMGLGWFLHANTSLFPKSNGVLESSMFLGVSMCITAFPMLARIIHQKGLTGTRIGTVTLGAGAIDDASAWCLLAVVLSSLDSHPSGAILNIFGGLLFVAVCAFVIRPILNRTEGWFISDDRLSDAGFVTCLVLMALAAFVTDAIGLHAVFGAFVMGVMIPRGRITSDATTRIEPLTLSLLLPLFFTFSGLNTKIGLLDSWKDWGFCLLVLLTAVAGKGLACWRAARFTGIPHREALSIGILMNARGMMELIIINIGREKGLISDELFAMLVVMALVTTLMTAPAFDRIVRNHPALTVRPQLQPTQANA